MTVADAIRNVLGHGWPRVREPDGVVHVLYGYSRSRGLYHYWCDAPFTLNAHETEVCGDYITCVACAAREEHVGGANPLEGVRFGPR